MGIAAGLIDANHRKSGSNSWALEVERRSDMDNRMQRIINRFPEHESIIRSLSKSNARFQDLVFDHHDIHQKLESEDEPGRQEELRSGLKNLEDQLIRIIQGSPML